MTANESHETSRLRRFLAILSTAGQRAWQALEAGESTRRGVQAVAWVLLLGMAAVFGGPLHIGVHPAVDPVLGILLVLLLTTLAAFVAAIAFRLLRKLAQLVTWRALLILTGTLVAAVALDQITTVVALPLGILLLAFGATVGALLGTRGPNPSRAKQGGLAVFGLAFGVILILVLASYAGKGTIEHLECYSPPTETVSPLAMENPGLPGPYTVRTLNYGSGTDRRRADFGERVDIITQPVDGSVFLKGSASWKMKARALYWGFDETKLPVNGRVWCPDGKGPFPLALVVHGNHTMEDYSDVGYEWLGQLLASRGIILVSVDENFLNGSWRGSLDTENDARGWLLLKHLEAWTGFAADSSNPFFQRVDLDRVALIGHSRGGEAVAIAAAFNQMSRYPDDATIVMPHGFGIRSVVAIAPSDGQYEPAGRGTPMKGVSYLVLQGGHDSDVSIFMGARQWHRANVQGSPNFKASVWIYRANHGQFNTAWGDADFGWPTSVVINRAPLLSGESQRQAGGVFISAFLEATLQDGDGYRMLFRDHRTGRQWLPDDLFITRYEDADVQTVASFEEDINPCSGSQDGIKMTGKQLAVWREEQLSARAGFSKENAVTILGWRRDPGTQENDDPNAPVYTLELEGWAGRQELDAQDAFVLSLTDMGEEPEEKDEHAANGDEDGDAANGGDPLEEDGPLESIDFTVRLTDMDGDTARLPLSAFRHLAPPVPSKLIKLPIETLLLGGDREPTLQTVELPLAAFMAVNADIEPARLISVSLIFDRTETGMLALDDLGFRITR